MCYTKKENGQWPFAQLQPTNNGLRLRRRIVQVFLPFKSYQLWYSQPHWQNQHYVSTFEIVFFWEQLQLLYPLHIISLKLSVGCVLLLVAMLTFIWGYNFPLTQLFYYVNYTRSNSCWIVLRHLRWHCGHYGCSSIGVDQVLEKTRTLCFILIN